MDQISVERQYEQYREALGYCRSETLARSREEIEYALFEGLEPTLRCSFCDSTLERLHKAGYLDDLMVESSREIFRRALPLFEREWTVEEVRLSQEWIALMHLVDRTLERGGWY